MPQKILSSPGTPRHLRWALFAAFLGSTTALQAQEAETPPLASLCFGCHGPNGVSASLEIPSLAGQNESYLFKRLMELKTEQTPSEIMKGVTHQISEEDLKLLANFFARQPYVRNEQPAEKERAARGRDVYMRICDACHKEEGRATVFAEYPLLAGQSLNYMLNELDHILARKRQVDIIKTGTLSRLSRDEIVDAVHFFAGQQVSPEQIKNTVNEPPKPAKRTRHK